jgi:NAD(P)-dependent dehydrogenase (short-subunit alcohol dehydrogenase family)
MTENGGSGWFDGACALVTGAGSGIGRATALALARDGARVVASDIDAARGGNTVVAIGAAGGEAHFVALDVTDETAWEAAFAATAAAFGPPRVLVNNAGTLPEPIALAETTLASWRRVTAVNLDGVFLGLKHGIRAMRESGGAIVNLASVFANVGALKIGGYGAAKAGVISLTRSAAVECAAFGYAIRINAVCPGYIDTGMTAEVAAAAGRDVRETMARQAPMLRMGRPAEIAEAIVFLASERSSFATGTTLTMDGGYTAR